MNESQTKHDLIDPALHKAGWGVVAGSRIRLEFPITQGRLIGQGRRAQPLKADYVLEYKNKRIAVIEAKARDKYYTDGVAQAKDYAQRLTIRFTYSTNGLQIYQVDMEQGTEGDIVQFPTPDELWEMTYPVVIEPNTELEEIESWKKRFNAVPFENRGGTWKLRYYQDNAISRVLDAIANKEDRILLTLATGTGKTAIAFQIAWKLFHTKWNLRRDGTRSPRILFLADRNILADQAFNAFNAFEEDALVRIYPGELPSNRELEQLKKGTIHSIAKKGKVPKNGNLFFSIFQTFASGSYERPYYEEYPEDFFDLIIIDECHRGGARDESSWRDIMNYFSLAVQLGLTATPKRDINADTYDYFKDPVYIYSLKEGINDGYLTPFKYTEIATTGDSYIFTNEDEVLEGEIEEGYEYSKEEQNRIIEIMDIERFKVQLMLKQINQQQKSLVFCATQIHAAAIRDLINQCCDSNNPNYCHRVTADDGKRGEQHLRDFQDNEKSIPTILTTSQKLSTGVDAPEIRNIVLMRSVKSMVEFKQIVGRGTRLFDGKDYFTVYDFFNASKKFSDPEWDGEPEIPEPPKNYPDDSATDNGSIKDSKAYFICGNDPCACDKPPRKIIKVRLSKNNIRQLDSMIKTSFWDPSGKPITSSEFMRQLFGDIPKLFKNENELRKIWSLPSTRKQLLNTLDEMGYSYSQLEDLTRVVHGKDSDLYDVLNYIAYNKDLLPRLTRVENVRKHLSDYNPKQQEFLEFVLLQYSHQGVYELDDDKLPHLLELKYHAIADAQKQLGDLTTIRETFIGFQHHLYDVLSEQSIQL